MKLRWWIVGYLIALGAAALSPFASGAPDGLERVAQDKGFEEASRGPVYETIPDYLLPGVEDERLATVLAGWIGVTALFLVVGGLAYLVSRRRPHETSSGGSRA
jgi:hypothetical protein